MLSWRGERRRVLWKRSINSLGTHPAKESTEWKRRDALGPQRRKRRGQKCHRARRHQPVSNAGTQRCTGGREVGGGGHTRRQHAQQAGAWAFPRTWTPRRSACWSGSCRRAGPSLPQHPDQRLENNMFLFDYAKLFPPKMWKNAYT